MKDGVLTDSDQEIEIRFFRIRETAGNGTPAGPFAEQTLSYSACPAPHMGGHRGAPALNAMKPGDVVVWWMDVASPSPETTRRWSECLDSAEGERAAKFHFQEDRDTYMAAHWLLRMALASVGGRPARDWRFVIERLGKPRIDSVVGLPKIQFNLSHTRGLVACAISLDAEIGIDAERLAPERVELDVATRYFSSSEVEILRRTAPDCQGLVFFRFWTLKEAFIKATGQGLSRALDSFSFSLDPVSIALPPEEVNQVPQWRFIELRPTDSHLLALAVRRSTAA
jgi:4'-phosphopantetheinyl transferase